MAALAALFAPVARSAEAPIALPTGQFMTPTAMPGSTFTELNPHLASSPTYTVGQAVSTAVSPDGKTLLVLTSGYNMDSDSATVSEFVFVFDISGGTPVQLQAVPVPNAFCGVAWAPDGSAFYVAGGQNDNLHTYTKSGATWGESGTPVALNHTAYGVSQPSGNGLFSLPGFGAAVSPMAAGVGVTADGSKVIVANLENDSISIVDRANGSAVSNFDLRPGKSSSAQAGVPGGEFPFWVAVKGNETIYVSSERDREIDVVSLAGSSPAVTERIPVKGNPTKMVLNKAGTKLFVAADNADQLYVIDTASNKVVGSVATTAPASMIPVDSHTGSSPNSVTLSPDETIAYVTNEGSNSVAVINVAGPSPVVEGLIPTGWYPNAISTSADGKVLYIVNGKTRSGPIPNGTTENYVLQRTKAGFLTMPTPTLGQLRVLTNLVARNNGFDFKESSNAALVMDFLHHAIKHVIYIVKENRTYDQILGDLPVGNGDPALTMYGKALTPNFHTIAGDFVDLDNFYCAAEISMNGWQWSTAGRGNDLNEKIGPVNYGKGGGSYDSEGLSRDIDVALPTIAERVTADPVYGIEAKNDPDVLPGTANVVALDGPAGEVGAGYIWNAAMRAKLSVRNYGFFLDLVRYEAPASLGGITTLRDPAKTHTQVAFPAEPALMHHTDPYFRGFDNRFPDFYRFQEWAREFDGYVAHNNLPVFETVRFMHDHTGNFDVAIDGVNTPELQQADDDYAVGLLVDKIAHSKHARDTLIFIVEDDSQDGPDHVDSHRSTGYIVGPYVKHGKVVSTRYNTVSMLRTMEDILGLQHLSLHDAGTAPMADVFNIYQGPTWTFSAVPAQALYGTQLPLPPKPADRHADLPTPLHDAAWWAEKAKGFRFLKEDQNDEEAYNRLLWQGSMGDRPYPTERSGLDLRNNREELLEPFKVSESN
jgi:YVTN family beta-propeller protein